jgi:ABC-2 type transport system ATP-binding protein
LLADVEDVCDRVCILYGGQQRAAGDMASLLTRDTLTQITTEKLAPDTIERVRALIRQLEQKDVLSVTAPSDKLENLFLRIVKEAQARNIKTSGAREVGQLPAFLGATAAEERTVIDSLVRAGAQPKPVGSPIPVRESAEQGRERAAREAVVEKLMSKKEVAVPAEVHPVKPPKPREPVEADRAVIDSLLRGEGDRGRE